MILSKTFSEKPLIANRSHEFAFIALGLQLAAFWSVWRWLFIRFSTSGEEFWGIFALAAALFFYLFQPLKSDVEIKSTALLFASIFLFIYALSFAFAPPLVRGILAAISLTLVLSDWRFGRTFHIGLFTLLLLGLPVIASLKDRVRHLRDV